MIEAEIEQLIIIKDEHKNNHMSNFIVDVSLITKKLDINKINLLLMNELNTGIDPTAINQELSFNSNTFEINKEETKNDLNSKLYGLNERSKNEELSLDQRGLLKEMLSTQRFSLKEVQLRFNISYSVLNRIKRCPFSGLNKQNSRKVTKISN